MTVSMETVRMENRDQERTNQNARIHLKTILPYNKNCYRPLRRECGIECMNLNSKTDCIMLTMLERMRLTCCVLPQGKALEVPCIISYEMYRLPNI